MAYKYRHLFFLLLGLQVGRSLCFKLQDSWSWLQGLGQVQVCFGCLLVYSWMSKCPSQVLFREDGKNSRNQAKPCKAHESLCLCLFTNTSMAKARPMAKLKVNGSGIYIFHILCWEALKSHVQRVEFIIIMGRGGEELKQYFIYYNH